MQLLLVSIASYPDMQVVDRAPIAPPPRSTWFSEMRFCVSVKKVQQADFVRVTSRLCSLPPRVQSTAGYQDTFDHDWIIPSNIQMIHVPTCIRIDSTCTCTIIVALVPVLVLGWFLNLHVGPYQDCMEE